MEYRMFFLGLEICVPCSFYTKTLKTYKNIKKVKTFHQKTYVFHPGTFLSVPRLCVLLYYSDDTLASFLAPVAGTGF